MRAPASSLGAPHARDERPRGRQDNDDDQRRAKEQEEQVPQLEPPGTLPLCLAQVPQRREVELRGRAALEQVEQRGERGGGEPQQSQRVEKAHVRRRSATPKGMSVSTW